MFQCVVHHRCRIDNQRFGPFVQKWDELRAHTQCNQHEYNRHKKLFGLLTPTVGPVLRGKTVCDPIQHHCDQCNNKADQKAFPKLSFANCRQYFPTDIVGSAYDRCDDHHRQGRHCRLVHAQQHLGLGGGQFYFPKKLRRCCARNQARFDDFTGHGTQAQDRIPDHRWKGI